MSDLKAKFANFRWAPTQTLLGELAALLQTP